MVRRVRGPDGTIVEFPDDTPNATINQAMQQRFGRKTTGLGAGAAGAAQGLTFGLSDEILAGAGALYDVATGADDLGEAYERRVGEQREYLRQAAEENPAWYYGGEIASAVALPFSAPGRLAARGAGALASRLGARSGLARGAGTGAIEGAGYGALSGLGRSEGDLQARAEGALGGTLAGGAVGGVAGAAVPAIAEGVARGLGRARGLMGRTLTPEAQAARDVAEAMRMGERRVGPEARRLIQSGQVGEDLMRGDISEGTTSLARSAANVSPEARAIMNEALDPRFEQQAQRAAEFIQGQAGGRLTGTMDEVRAGLQQRARDVNRVNYDRAYMQGDRPLTSPKIERILASPMGQRAYSAAAKGLQDDLALSGRPARNYNNLELLDLVKQNIDDVAGAAQRLGQGNQARKASGMARELRDELDKLVPSYKGTRSKAAEFFGAEDAVTAGENFARGGIKANPAQMRAAKNRFTPQERQLFEEAYQNSLMREIAEVGDRSNIAARFANSPARRQRLEIGLGKQNAKDFEAFLHVEGLMNKFKEAVQGNSSTARQLAEAGLWGGTAYAYDPQNMSQAGLVAVVAPFARKYMAQKAGEKWATRVAELLTRADDNPEAFERALRQISRREDSLNALRDISRRLSAAIGGRVAGSTAAQEAPLRVTVTGQDVEQAQGR